jgi:adenylyl-sulfate kinase
MIARTQDGQPAPQRFIATLLWLDKDSLEKGRPYLLKHGLQQVCANVRALNGTLNPERLVREPAAWLGLNGLGEVEIETHQPLYFDPNGEHCTEGAFIVLDPLASGTLGIGMIADGSAAALPPLERSPARGLTACFTGLSSAGKSTISKALYDKLREMGRRVEWLDGDVVRQHLNNDLGFTKADRDENVRRIGFVAELLSRIGVIVLVSAISPYRSIREEIRNRISDFIEVYVDAPLEVCEHRDLKGIYRRARAGQMAGVTGIDDPYERPLAPEVECKTDRETPAESARRVLDCLRKRMGQNE